MPQFSIIGAAVAVVVGGLLASCAPSVQGLDIEEQGPALFVEGRISIRRPGHPTLIASFTWARGVIGGGWSERITLTGADGLRLLRMVSTDAGVSIITPRRTFTHPSFEDMLQREIGITVAPGLLASWLENEHLGQPLPDQLIYQGIQVEVIERHDDAKPYRLRVIHNETVLLIVTNIQQF